MPVVDRKQLHTLFLSGKPIREIATELGSTPGSIRTMIFHERIRNPLEWPHRIDYPSKPTDPPLMMHGYSCTACSIVFAVEDYDEVDHSTTVCPICLSDESLEDKFYGRFIPTSST